MDWNYFVENFQFVSIWWAFILPVSLEVIDFLTGYINACIKGERDSAVMRRGGGKKFAEAICLLVAQLFTWAMALPVAFVYAVSLYICWMETLSIIENVKKLGVPVPTDVQHKIDEKQEELFKEAEENIQDEMHDEDG